MIIYEVLAVRDSCATQIFAQRINPVVDDGCAVAGEKRYGRGWAQPVPYHTAFPLPLHTHHLQWESDNLSTVIISRTYQDAF